MHASTQQKCELTWQLCGVVWAYAGLQKCDSLGVRERQELLAYCMHAEPVFLGQQPLRGHLVRACIITLVDKVNNHAVIHLTLMPTLWHVPLQDSNCSLNACNPQS
jgi:hypothetical protein